MYWNLFLQLIIHLCWSFIWSIIFFFNSSFSFGCSCCEHSSWSLFSVDLRAFLHNSKISSWSLPLAQNTLLSYYHAASLSFLHFLLRDSWRNTNAHEALESTVSSFAQFLPEEMSLTFFISWRTCRENGMEIKALCYEWL